MIALLHRINQKRLRASSRIFSIDTYQGKTMIEEEYPD